MPEVLQGTLNPAVAPPRILTRHPDGQLADFTEHARSADASSISGPFTGDELSMPPQNRVRHDQRRHIAQDLSSEAAAAWRVVDAILSDETPLTLYAQHSWGPTEADRLAH